MRSSDRYIIWYMTQLGVLCLTLPLSLLGRWQHKRTRIVEDPDELGYWLEEDDDVSLL
jgi:hypothetical protein